MKLLACVAGKSCFGVYLVYEFARWFAAQVAANPAGWHLRALHIIYDNVLEDKDATTHRFHFKVELPPGTPFGAGAGAALVWTVVRVTNLQAQEYDNLLNNDWNTIYIVDGGENSGHVHTCFSVWLTSAKKDHISAACRRPRGCLKALYQPPWSLEELLAANAMLHSASFSPAFVSYLFDMWGGSVRYVLAEPSVLLKNLPNVDPLRVNLPLSLPLPAAWPEVVSGLSGAVALSNLPSIKQFAGSTSSKVPDDVSSKLMHIFPLNQHLQDYGHAFRETVVKFASPYAASEVAKQLACTAKYELFLFLVTAQGNPTLGEVARDLFEGHCHNLMRQLPPVAFKRRPLAGGPVVMVTFPAPPVAAIIGNERPEVLFENDQQIATIPATHHGRPASREFPAVDIIRPQTAPAPCELDQATVALQHPEKIVGFTRIHKQLNAPAYHLNFLVPHNHFAAFAVQPYHDTHGLVAALPGGINITQYAIEIDLSLEGMQPQAGAAAIVAGAVGSVATGAVAAGSKRKLSQSAVREHTPSEQPAVCFVNQVSLSMRCCTCAVVYRLDKRSAGPPPQQPAVSSQRLLLLPSFVTATPAAQQRLLVGPATAPASWPGVHATMAVTRQLRPPVRAHAAARNRPLDDLFLLSCNNSFSLVPACLHSQLVEQK